MHIKGGFMHRILFFILLFFNNITAAYIITYDETEFYSSYENPTEIIDFTTLKDGTDISVARTIVGTSIFYTGASHPGGSGSPAEYLIRENAWSDILSIRGKTRYGYWAATWWDGNSIRLDNISPTLSLYNPNRNSYLNAIALSVTSDIYSGFVGFMPESNTETHYLLGGLANLEITNLSMGFYETQIIPEPSILALMSFGLVSIGYSRRKAKKLP